MAVEWIKLFVDMFDNRKIKYIRSLPEGNNILLIWIMLLTMAGRTNDKGRIYLTEEVPYSPKMLADELGFSENVVLIALKTFQSLKMIDSNDSNDILVVGWEEHQNAASLDRIREQTRKRVANYREKQKQLPENTQCNVTCNENVTLRNDSRVRVKNIDTTTINNIDLFNSSIEESCNVTSQNEGSKCLNSKVNKPFRDKWCDSHCYFKDKCKLKYEFNSKQESDNAQEGNDLYDEDIAKALDTIFKKK